MYVYNKRILYYIYTVCSLIWFVCIHIYIYIHTHAYLYLWHVSGPMGKYSGFQSTVVKCYHSRYFAITAIIDPCLQSTVLLSDRFRLWLIFRVRSDCRKGLSEPLIGTLAQQYLFDSTLVDPEEVPEPGRGRWVFCRWVSCRKPAKYPSRYVKPHQNTPEIPHTSPMNRL